MYICNNCAKNTRKLYPIEFNRPENYNELPSITSSFRHVKLFVCSECLEEYEGHLVKLQGRMERYYRDFWIKIYKERFEESWGK
jgi:protein-arginine kinase activator protein McsA